MIHSEFASASSLVAPHAVMPCPPRITPTACGLVVVDRGDVEAELEAGAAPRHPDDLVAEDVLGEPLAVGRGRDRDAAVGVQVVDVRGRDQAVHRGVDRRRRAALAVQAEVEGGDHLVLAVLAGVDVDERAQPVEAQHGEPGFGERAEVAAGALHPQQLDVLAGDRVDVGCPWPRCCRRRSWCCAGRRRAGSTARAAPSTAGCMLTRPSRPARRRRARRRSARRSRSRGRPPSGRPAGPRSTRHSARSARTSV